MVYVYSAVVAADYLVAFYLRGNSIATVDTPYLNTSTRESERTHTTHATVCCLEGSKVALYGTLHL